jgi:glycine/D-amino acid oxidase-like deaminating enzyme
MPSKRVKVAIVGGGIGGLSAANAMLRRGIDVTVWEQADPLGETGTGLSLFPNGRRQLERMELGEALAEVGAKIGDGSGYSLLVESSPPTRVVGVASMECTGLIYCGYSPEVSRRLRYARVIVASGSNRVPFSRS